MDEKKPNVGAPKGNQNAKKPEQSTQQARYSLKMTADQKARFQKTADHLNMPLGQFLREAAEVLAEKHGF